MMGELRKLHFPTRRTDVVLKMVESAVMNY
jgi:hypothetical protein